MARPGRVVVVRVSIVVSISACHADDPGSIPGRGILFRDPDLSFLPQQLKRLGVTVTGIPYDRPPPVQACGPATEDAVRFSLLCFQPEALLESLDARQLPLSPKMPCDTPP